MNNHPVLTTVFASSKSDDRTLLNAVLKATASVGLTYEAGMKIVEAVKRGASPSVIWLHFQECTGCTDYLLRARHSDISDAILNHVSLTYHKTSGASDGFPADDDLRSAMKENAGRYICVVEGAIPQEHPDSPLKNAGPTAIEMLKEVANSAGLVVAIGSCASWGAVPSAEFLLKGAEAVGHVLRGRKVVNISGCPANPYIFLGTVLQYAMLGTVPELDAMGRPRFAYAQVIQGECPRKNHFDAGRFASRFGDEGDKLGYCLYKLGCKGPFMNAACTTHPACEMVETGARALVPNEEPTQPVPALSPDSLQVFQELLELEKDFFRSRVEPIPSPVGR
jgi:hydrogenase small subunit